MTRPRLIAAMLLALLVLSLPPAPAEAATRMRVCKSTATLRDSPKGFVIARLQRGDRVAIVRRSAKKGWSTVSTSGGLSGWILSRSLCRA